MRNLMTTIAAAALLGACGAQTPADSDATSPTKSALDTTMSPDTTATTPFYDLAAQYAKFAKIPLNPDTSFLSASEKAVLNKLIEASKVMSEIYLLQLNPNNPAIRAEIANSDAPNKDLLLAMFDEHFGVCDTLAEGHVFYGDMPCPDGAGFYPADMTKDEFNAWIAANPDDEAAFKSGYSVIRRDGDRLVAVPYSVEYKEPLTRASALLKEAAALSENASLKRFLDIRADSFLSDDYFDSEMAWMDLDGAIEIAIGPYEVYDDKLFGYKTAFESFVTIKDPEASKALAKYKNYLKDMEKNLPVPDSYKNFQRGFESPIVVADQIQGGGDNVPGVQTIAFNLPNDERVREAKGAKKVILTNVLGAKYDRILAPIGERVLEAEQAALTVKKYMANNTLFHELSHSLGPGSIIKDGRKTTVNAELQELSSGLEEGKADVMGAYNILYMMSRGELPPHEREAFLATYFTGLFRSMRFGIDAAHGKGAAFQYSYFREVGAVTWLPEQERFRVNFNKLADAIGALTGQVVTIQGDGDYDNAKIFLDHYGKLDTEAETVLSKLEDIPYDITPIYPSSVN
ncbi:hypothetical protein [Fretibacter rubidus]|uniref:dipeptidyl-peptidase 3 family protein n=1 Tax=Fretibacter rubidus TaxID=570162 RepID=UPI003529EC6F